MRNTKTINMILERVFCQREFRFTDRELELLDELITATKPEFASPGSLIEIIFDVIEATDHEWHRWLREPEQFELYNTMARAEMSRRIAKIKMERLVADGYTVISAESR